jgi:hypothetical protein
MQVQFRIAEQQQEQYFQIEARFLQLLTMPGIGNLNIGMPAKMSSMML